MNNPFQELMSNPGFMTYTYVSGILGMVVSGVLLVSGFGLLNLRPWARYFSIGYGVYSWIAIIVGGILSYFLIYAPVIEGLSEKAGPETAPFMGGMLFGMIGGSCFSVVYPTILLIFMFLPDVKAAFQPGWGTPPPMPPVARQ